MPTMQITPWNTHHLQKRIAPRLSIIRGKCVKEDKQKGLI